MSRLEGLIAELCPNGVEYKRLGEIAEMQRGSSVTKKDVVVGNIPVISGGKEPAYYCDQYNRTDENITVAGSGAGAGYVQYWNKPIFVCDAFSIKGIKDVNTKYLYYYLSNIQEKIYATKKGGGVPHVHISSIDSFLIPIPPLPVQVEIVRILDNFTELTAELTARKKQYEFYRDKLLIFDVEASDCEWRTLHSVTKSYCSGGTPTKSNSDYYDSGTIPWIRTQDVHFNEIHEVDTFITETALKETSAKWIPENCVIVAISGASAGRCAINKIRAATNQHCLNMEIDPAQALYKYVYHCVCNKYQDLIAKKQGARGDLNSTLILETEIPIPPLPVQQRIVNVLDNFDAICSDLNIGLPAEIEARQKQYEYYRNLLLSFDDCSQLIHVERERERERERNRRTRT